MTFWREGCLAIGLLMFCVIAAKGLSAGWFQITVKKPIDVRMREPEPQDITVQDLLRQRQPKRLRSGFQRGFYE